MHIFKNGPPLKDLYTKALPGVETVAMAALVVVTGPVIAAAAALYVAMTVANFFSGGRAFPG